MIDQKKILSLLLQRWRDGETQADIAKKAGISQPYLCDLISGKADVEGLTIKKLNALFPEASLNLEGDSVSIHADYNSGNVVGINHGKISTACIAAVVDKILESDELSDTEKVKVMKVLKK